MLFEVSEDRQLIGSTELQFKCASCDQKNAVDALRFKTINKWIGLITIWVTHETAVKCPDCLATFRSQATLEELSQLSTDQIGARFRLRIGFIEKFLVIAAWLFVFIAPVSFAMFLGAWFIVPQATRGWRRATLVGLWITAIYSVVWFTLMFLDIRVFSLDQWV